MAKAVKIFAAVLCAALLLELSLRIGGRIALSSARARPPAMQGRRVLCIGDSFVWGIGGKSFPEQLGEILDEKAGRGVFSVINEGKPGSNSSYVAAAIDKALREYRPEAVIILTGISNTWNASREAMPSDGSALPFWRRLRLWKLAELVWSGEYAVNAEAARARRAVEAMERGQAVMEIGPALSAVSDSRYGLAGLYAVAAGLYCAAHEHARGRAELDKAEQLLSKRGMRVPTEFIQACLDCGRPQMALRAAERALDAQPDSDRVAFLSALAYKGIWKVERAQELLSRAIALSPGKWEYYYEMGNLLEYDRARSAAYFLKAARLNPYSALPRYALGLGWLGYFNWRSAEAEFKLALHADPSHEDSLSRLAELYVRNGTPEKFAALELELPALGGSRAYRRIAAGLPELRAGGGEMLSEIGKDIGYAVTAARRSGARVIISSYPEENLESARGAAKNLGADYVDFTVIFRDRFKSRAEYISFDKSHCNTAGYRLMAEVFSGIILNEQPVKHSASVR